ncbi:asparagine synthase (glutamine-hydrolyzing) [Paracoccaceae bacterium]|nr:asparagine synthase (glutamine-hydrolyzing) [Paracoccaceae bacterium]
MCGIAGYFHQVNNSTISNAEYILNSMLRLQSHRGPDYSSFKIINNCGLAHNRLSIIDLSAQANQPMVLDNRFTIVFNGEIYNYKELTETILASETFITNSDTEVIVKLYRRYGTDCLRHLRGMFAFAIYDQVDKTLFLARDRIGIKPLYYTVQNDILFFASEIKTLLPHLLDTSVNYEVLNEYFHFNYGLGEETLINSIFEVKPGNYLLCDRSKIEKVCYWEIPSNYDYSLTEEATVAELEKLFNETIKLHSTSDVEIGGYVSGGVDSSLVYTAMSDQLDYKVKGFNGRFLDEGNFDESKYAYEQVKQCGGDFHVSSFNSDDFLDNIEDICFHLDNPVVGPGAIPQYLISREASKFVKVITGGQGGDEVFGGYARYLLCYFEQALKHRINGTDNSGALVLTLETILPNLELLSGYEPMMQSLFSNGLFGSVQDRYFDLVNRSRGWESVINSEILVNSSAKQKFNEVFSRDNNKNLSALDLMTRFDFRTSLKGLLQVEDRMSMAHGLESRVPLLDHKFIEFAASIPAHLKYKNGEQKRLLKILGRGRLTNSILRRTDKMGFPIPLNNWINGPLKTYFNDLKSDTLTHYKEIYNQANLADNKSNDVYSRLNWSIINIHHFLNNLKGIKKIQVHYA